jgi:hypothetical protein
MQLIYDTFVGIWGQYWPIIYDVWFEVPPILWILLGVLLLVAFIPRRRIRMSREDMVRRIVSDSVLDMLERLADMGTISWKEAEKEMLRMGRNFAWGDLVPRRLAEYKMTEKDIKQLKGIIKARRDSRRTAGADKAVDIPGDPPTPKTKKLSSGRIGQLIKQHTL